MALLVGILPALAAVPAPAQVGEPAGTELPETLTTDQVESLVAQRTDAEIRALLLAELRRRAEERAAEDVAAHERLKAIGARLASMAETIEERVVRWSDALANLGDRAPEVAERLARAEGGLGGMLLAAAIVVVAGFGAAWGVSRLTAPARRLLADAENADYWERLLRTASIGAVEMAAVVAFVLVTVTVAPLVGSRLGPLVDYVWIYQVGISYSWGAIIIVRRAFDPDVPAVRIAPLGDPEARRITSVLTAAILVGMGGWLTAGLFPTLGLGFPPAMVTVGSAGTAAAAILLISILRDRRTIRQTVAEVAGQERLSGRLAAAAAPWLLVVYVVIAWGYWLAHWLERGAQRLIGPAGTLVVLLVLPILDRLGAEMIGSVLPAPTAAAERFREVLRGAWRALIGLVAVFVVARLWGLHLLALAKGPEAGPILSMLFDIAVTLLIGRVVWRMIRAALHREPRPAGGEEAEVEFSAASRLDTLVPLLRNVLLFVLAAVVAMIVLSSVGVDIGPLLASAGIVGIAIGFGAQNLVRDVFSGAFFLVDDAFRVGEYIELENDLRGEVEAITVRSLQLRHHKGAVITIPFGEVKRVINHNRDWVIYKMNFRLEPETDPQVVKKVVKAVGAELMEHPEHGPKFLEPLKSQGVLMIDDDSALVIRVKFKCRPRAQFVLRREVHHRLREAFAGEGILFARRKVEVVTHGAEAPPGLPDEVLDPQPAAAVRPR